MKVFRHIPAFSTGFGTQPAIFQYRLPGAGGREDTALSGGDRRDDAAQVRMGSKASLRRLPRLLAVEHAGESHERRGGACGTLLRAVSYAVAILAEVGAGQGHMLHRHECHRFTPIIVALDVKAPLAILRCGESPETFVFVWMPGTAAKVVPRLASRDCRRNRAEPQQFKSEIMF